MTYPQVTITKETAKADLGRGAAIEVPTARLNEAGTPNDELGILPPAVRWISRDHSRVIFERPPSRMSIYYCHSPAYSAKNHRHYIIPVPWQVYVVTMSPTSPRSQPGLQFYVRPGPLRTAEDKLYSYPMPNTNGGGVCIHVEREYAKLVDAGATIAERVSFMAGALWMSGSNTNAGDVLRSPTRHPKEFLAKESCADAYKVLEALEKYSLSDVLSWTYPDTRATFGSLMQTGNYGGGLGQQRGDVVDRLIADIQKARATGRTTR